MKQNNITKRVVTVGIIAALYAVLTMVLAPISYGPVQFRVSELLVLLAFIDPMYIIGLTLGCAVSNLLGGYGPIDIIFGSAATMLAGIATYITAVKIRNKNTALIIGSIWPTIFNGVIIGWVLNVTAGLPLIPSMISVAIGEFVVVTVIGVPLYKLIENKYGKTLSKFSLR